ncbi:DUF397 domain-containing protein [Streptomyces sp. NPDC090077]|uniref:DUF397 domain-containing protein n=1 Tax=Streptomyces sp. NPDC090077 TaxID=3365938 RepID=UPI0038213BB5
MSAGEWTATGIPGLEAREGDDGLVYTRTAVGGVRMTGVHPMTLQSAPTAAELAAAPWRTSSYSAVNNECVEVAADGAWVGLRDSKRPQGAVLVMQPAAFAALTDALKADAL